MSNLHELFQMTCELVLGESEPLSYKVGDTVDGHLVINVVKPFYVNVITVALEGSAIVTSGSDKIKAKKDMFLKLCMDVYGKGDKTTFPVGMHRLPFAIMIPYDSETREIPGSMRMSHGFVEYLLVVYLKQDVRCYKQAEKSITVESYLNLSAHESSLMTPITYEKIEKSLCHHPFSTEFSKSKPQKFCISLRLRKSGFLPGESIPFELEMNNPGEYEIVVSGVTLVQKFTYNFGPTQKIQMYELRSVETRVLQGQSALWADAVIIPEDGLVPSQSGVIIEISHFLKVRVTSNSPDGPFVLEIPLKIGTTN